MTEEKEGELSLLLIDKETIAQRIRELTLQEQHLNNRIKELQNERKKETLTILVDTMFLLLPAARYAAVRQGRIYFYEKAPRFEHGEWKGTPLKTDHTSTCRAQIAVDIPSGSADFYYWERGEVVE